MLPGCYQDVQSFHFQLPEHVIGSTRSFSTGLHEQPSNIGSGPKLSVGCTLLYRRQALFGKWLLERGSQVSNTAVKLINPSPGQPFPGRDAAGFGLQDRAPLCRHGVDSARSSEPIPAAPNGRT